MKAPVTPKAVTTKPKPYIVLSFSSMSSIPKNLKLQPVSLVEPQRHCNYEHLLSSNARDWIQVPPPGLQQRLRQPKHKNFDTSMLYLS
jgi:hypothetical protein